MGVTTVNFLGYRGEAAYTCPCSGCGKTLKRKVVEEHTHNPWNRNDDGSVRTVSEVIANAKKKASALAAAKQGVASLCLYCEERPMRELLTAMSAEPERVFPDPQPYWNSPMHYLHDRKQVDRVYSYRDGDRWNHEPGNCVLEGWRATPAGVARASKFKPAAAAKETT